MPCAWHLGGLVYTDSGLHNRFVGLWPGERGSLDGGRSETCREDAEARIGKIQECLRFGVHQPSTRRATGASFGAARQTGPLAGLVVTSESGIERILLDALQDGKLDRELHRSYRRWHHLMSFAEFRSSVLERVWTERSRFAGSEPAQFFVWLRVLAFRVALDIWRKEKRAKTRLARYLRLAARATYERKNAVETRHLVEWLLAGLSDRERFVLVARYDSGTPTDAIANDLGVSIAAVKQLHYRALRKLRRKAVSERQK